MRSEGETVRNRANARRLTGQTVSASRQAVDFTVPFRALPMLAGEARHIASDRAGFLGSHVWMPPVVQGAISMFRTRDRVRSCVRPPGAAFSCRGPVWRCADRVQITLGALEGRCGFPWFSRSGSSIICPCKSFAFLTPRTPDPSAGRGLYSVRPSRPPGNPRSSSSSPRRHAPSCWPVRSPPACAASSPASAQAMSLRARPFAGFAARWTWRR